MKKRNAKKMKKERKGKFIFFFYVMT